MILISLKGFIKKEFRQSLRDPVMQRLIFLAPILQLMVFGFALSNETKNIKMAVYAPPGDSIARSFEDKATGSGWFQAVHPQEQDPFKAIQSGEIEIALVISSKKLETASSQTPVAVQILINGIHSVRAQAIESYTQNILNESLYPNSSPRTLIPMDTKILFNPQMETSYFLIPALIGVIICLITVLLTSMSFTREREVGTLETILSAPIKKWEIIFGKAIPSVILAAINSLLTCSVGAIVFGMPFTGSLGLLILVIFVFILSTVSIGIAISTISTTQQQAMMGSFLFLFPALLLSGLMFPVENMPPAMKLFAELNPMTHFNYLMRNIILKGGDFEYVIVHSSIVAGIGILAIFVAFKNFKTTLN